MKILLSWIAYTYDFEGQTLHVSKTSPSLNIHQYGNTKYDKHFILSTKNKEDLKMDFLLNKLNTEIKATEFQKHYLNIPDAYDLQSILSSASELINKIPIEDEIDILFSNGTRAMSAAWIIYYANRSRPIKLLQGISPEYSKTKKSSFTEVNFTESFPGIIDVFENTKEEKILETDAYLNIRERAKKIAKYPITCTIIGESGTGKEKTAYNIHHFSARSNKKYQAVNCAAISDDLLESRLFGHKKGAFTGAHSDHIGFFESANGGSIFLDEIGDISPKLQVSLLRVLQEGKIMKIGSNEEEVVDVRIIAATNKNLEEEVKANRFREDLYYRLFETHIELKSLREYSIAEIKKLIDHFMTLNSKKFNKKLSMKENIKQQIASYDFPGNIRELQSIIINFFVFCDKEVRLEDLPAKITPRAQNSFNLENNIQHHITKTFVHFNKNIQQTAAALGIANNTLKKKLRAYALLNTPETVQTQK